MTVEEVLEVVKKDRLFYSNSGGGVTVSGGEPTFQPHFLTEFLRRCQEISLHTAIETCGFVNWKVLEEILEYIDLVIFDIKHMDAKRHKELVGVDNGLILDNATRLARKGKPIIIRMPLIPGHNDSEENIAALAKFLVETRLMRFELYPYHRFGVTKYRNLGREYKLNGVNTHTEEQIEAFKDSFESYGLEVSII